MKTVRGTWYEVWSKNNRGMKLPGPVFDTYQNLREAKKQIKESNERQAKAGYKPEEWYIMVADSIRTTDDNGMVVSETLTYAVA